MYQLKLTRTAKKEALEAAEFYRDLSLERAEGFFDQLEEACAKIHQRPEWLRFKKANVRYVRLKTYPYLVFFRLFEKTNRVVVFHVLHEKRHPDTWKKRL